MENISSALLDWFYKNHRILPFRTDPSPYHVWLSEIMLQQTRVSAALPYYERFLAALPDIPALAGCEEEKLHKLWEGLGYYSLAMFAGVAEMIARALVGFLFVPLWGYFAACIANPVAWFFACFFLIPAYIVVFRKLKQEKARPHANL